MADETVNEQATAEAPAPAAPEAPAEQQEQPAAAPPQESASPKSEAPAREERKGQQQPRGPKGEGRDQKGQPQQQQQQRQPGGGNQQQPRGERGERGDRGPRPGGGGGGERREHGGGGRPGGGGFRGEGPMMDIDLEKLIGDSLYLDNQAHAVVSRLRDMDSGTKSQLRRFYNAVRRACRTAEAERQHEFVMLRARLAYTIARHSLRGLDSLEKLLLQVTRKNSAPGYERFRDLFEAIVAYNE